MEDKELELEEKLEEEEVEETTTEETPKQEKAKVSNPFQDTIKAYLDNYSMSDENFKERYNNPDKNINDCCNYILNQVQKMGVQGFTDEEIFKMARDYYVDEISKDDTKSISGTVVVNHQVELTEEEKVKARVEAMKRFEEECLQEERKKREEEMKAQAKAEEKARKQEEARIRKEEEKKAIEEKKKAEELANAKAQGGGEQMSIFDF